MNFINDIRIRNFYPLAAFIPDTNNEIFHLAAELVNQTNRNLFLTGKAGTGKTTFLRHIRENCQKQMAIVAPTGVAAINAGGVTIHSFFQIPPGIFLPVRERSGFEANPTEVHNYHSLSSRLRFNQEKRKMFRQLELLVIDEVSMVRCDLLDAIDCVLRFVRKRPMERFGGVQLLFIGDLYQLPPVTKDQDWQHLSRHYSCPYFFDSHVLREELPLYIEFDKIYRQSDPAFISLLNQVRNNDLNEEGIALLESRYQPNFRRKKDDGYIILTTHNEQARSINAAQLQELESVATCYDARTEGDFPEHFSPADPALFLKTGAQVMFIKNDSAEKGKRFYNGKIGKVTRLQEDKVFVQCEGEEEITVEREKWQNIRYSLNNNTQKLEEDVLGSFSQFPLRLAWAITIHKSQGLTFEKAIIDAGEAFAPGQVYVALSRCTGLEGLVLKSRLRKNNMLTDPRVSEFSNQIKGSDWLKTELEKARKDYQEQLLLHCFDFEGLKSLSTGFRDYIEENKTSFEPESLSWAVQQHDIFSEWQQTGLRFQQWLKEQFLPDTPPEKIPAIQERTQKAAAHFIPLLTSQMESLAQSPVITDSRQHAKEANDLLKEIFTLISMSLHQLKGFNGGWTTEQWQTRRKNFLLPSININSYAGASQKQVLGPHPALYSRLRELRDQLCSKRDLPIYMVAGTVTLHEMARYLPQTTTELKQISGFGEAKAKQYGKQFLELILDYCGERNLGSLIHEKDSQTEPLVPAARKKKKGDSFAETFKLYKEGKTIAEIAEIRKLAYTTIEGHLYRFVRSGEIPVSSLVSADKYAMIAAVIQETGSSTTTPIKQQLPPDISYGEIRMVMAALDSNQQQAAE